MTKPATKGSFATRLIDAVGRFRQDRKAGAAVMIALSMIPIILAAGMAVDFGRAINVRSQLQRAVDSAALAGASAYSGSSTTAAATTAANEYMAAATANIKDYANVSYTPTLSTTTASSTVSVYKVKVEATAQLKTTIMSIVQSLVTVGVQAIADNPVYTVTISLSSFSSSAADGDSIYYYIVPTDNSTPSSASMTKMYSNQSSNNSGSVTVTLTAGQKIGFALVNVTGAQSYYGSNSYGGAYKSTHTFYSHMAPPSIIAYPSVPQNHALQVVTSLSAIAAGTQSSSPSLGAFSCSTAGTTPYYFAWNDMGGSGNDDGDYNDAVYKVGCSKTSSTAVNGVVLEQ